MSERWHLPVDGIAFAGVNIDTRHFASHADPGVIERLGKELLNRVLAGAFKDVFEVESHGDLPSRDSYFNIYIKGKSQGRHGLAHDRAKLARKLGRLLLRQGFPVSSPGVASASDGWTCNSH